MKNRHVLACVASLGLLAACAAPTPQVSRKPIAEPKPVQVINQGALACLAEAIYFEAGTHSEAGRVAVAHVILNRAADPRFPSTVCGVIREGEASGKCQFSYRCAMDTDLVRWPSKRANAQATAKAVLGGAAPDPTGGAIFFHASSIAPGWFASRPKAGTFGGNSFYL